MQQPNKFNNYVKDKLELFESPMQLDAGWASLQAKRKEKKKRKMVVFFSALFILVSFLGAFLYKGNDTSLLTQNSAVQASTPCVVDNNNLLEQQYKNNTSLTTVIHKAINNVSQNAVVIPTISSNYTHSADNVIIDSEANNTHTDVVYRDSIQQMEQLPTPLLQKVNHDIKPINTLEKVFNTPQKNLLDVYFRFGTSHFKQLHKAKDASNNDIADFRNRNEKNVQSLSYELGVRYALKKSSFLNLALNYDDWYTQFKLNQTIPKEYKLSNVVVRTITYQPGNQVEKIYGDTVIQGKQTINGVYYQHHKTMAIQLGVGKNFTHKRLLISPSIGIKYALYNKVSGKIINDLSNYTLEASDDKYKNNYWGVTGNFALAYKIKPKISIGVNLNSTYIHSNISSANYTLKTKMISNGIAVGFCYHLR